MADAWDMLLLQDATARTVAIGCGLLGASAGALGCFAILRRRALVSDAVAHAALPGVCVAYMLVGDRNFGALLGGAFVFGLIAAATISFIRRMTRIKDDAATAIAIGGFFGLGIVLSRIIQNDPAGNRAGLDGFIFGKAASLVWSDVAWIAAMSVAVLLSLAIFYKEFLVVCFDRAYCASLGWPAFVLELFLMTLITACAVVALPAVGAVLVVSLLIIPGLTARFWTNSLTTMVVLGAMIGCVSAVGGTVLSAVLPSPASDGRGGWPTGPLITLVAATLFFISMLVSPGRGILADWLRNRRFRSALDPQGDA